MRRAAERRATLRSLLGQGRALVVPGAYDAISARLVERAGFPLVYIGSYATAASAVGLPDVGLVSMTEMVGYARAINNSVSVPVLADAENGFNNAANIWRTVMEFEQAGVAGVHIEDREFGKHAPVRQVLLSLEEMIEKVRAALNSREDPNFLVIARTDAVRATDDLEEAIRRANAFLDVGADLVFVPGLTPERLRPLRQRIRGKVMVVNTPGFSAQDEEDAGADVVLYYGFCLYAAYLGVQSALAAFSEARNQNRVPDMLVDVKEFEEFIGYEAFTQRAKTHGLA